jgi:hypothetical protein
MLGAALLLWVLPGFGVLAASRIHVQTWLERVGISIGLSLCLYPVTFLLFDLLNLRTNLGLAWTPALIGLVALAFCAVRDWPALQLRWQNRRPLLSPRRWRMSAPSLLALLTIGAVIFVRFDAVHHFVAPAWGDSVHHTVIVQLLLENQGLFQNWSPYAQLDTFTYHFAFHAASTAWAVVTGQTADQAVLWTGQALNIGAVLVLAPLAVRVSRGSLWAGVAAMLLAGLLLSMPAYYVNWGRYTQLSAQVILPILLWALDDLWQSHKRPGLTHVGLIALLAAGLVLAHYRVTVLAGVAGIAWTIWGLWRWRGAWRMGAERLLALGGAALLALILVLPWLIQVRSGRLGTVARSIAGQDVRNEAFWQEFLSLPALFAEHYPGWLFSVGVLLLLLSLWRAPSLGIPMLLWTSLGFLLTNPYLVGLPGLGYVTNFLAIIGFYIPLAVLIGWAWSLLPAAPWLRAFPRLTQGVMALLVLGGMVYGVQQQLRMVDPFFQMVTEEDLAAFDWIRQHTEPEESLFLVNEFPAYSNSLVVGSDAGWWLPYYTQRRTTLPPILLFSEQLSPHSPTRPEIVQLERSIRASQGDPDLFTAILCESGITHIFLGQKQGQVGFGDTQLIHQAWLHPVPAFSLLYQAGNAQVWQMAPTICSE